MFTTKATYHETSQRADHGDYGFGRLRHEFKANREKLLDFHTLVTAE